MENRIHIFVGHFGSGKTETALNFAVKQAKDGKKVDIVDLDTVNPYFRTADAKEILETYGINVIVSDFAGSNVDIPTVPTETQKVFADKDAVGIIDVGGDEDGAFALGRYKREFENEKYQMHFVVNTKRPLTQNADDIIEYIESVEKASRLKVTDIFNNTNLADETTGDVLTEGYAELLKVSDRTGIPVVYNCGTKKTLENMACKNFEMEIFLKKPWENRKDR